MKSVLIALILLPIVEALLAYYILTPTRKYFESKDDFLSKLLLIRVSSATDSTYPPRCWCSKS